MNRSRRLTVCLTAAAAAVALAPAATAAPATATAARSVTIDATHIGKVKLGGTPGATVKQLTAVLGKPTSARWVEGCGLSGNPVAYEARWGAFSVYGQGASAKAVRMNSWTLTRGRTPVPIKVTRGIRLGMTPAQVKKTGARTTTPTRIWEDTWAMRAGGLDLFLTSRSPHRVDSIVLNPAWCE